MLTGCITFNYLADSHTACLNMFLRSYRLLMHPAVNRVTVISCSLFLCYLHHTHTHTGPLPGLWPCRGSWVGLLWEAPGVKLCSVSLATPVWSIIHAGLELQTHLNPPQTESMLSAPSPGQNTIGLLYIIRFDWYIFGRPLFIRFCLYSVSKWWHYGPVLHVIIRTSLSVGFNAYIAVLS